MLVFATVMPCLTFKFSDEGDEDDGGPFQSPPSIEFDDSETDFPVSVQRLP